MIIAISIGLIVGIMIGLNKAIHWEGVRAVEYSKRAANVHRTNYGTDEEPLYDDVEFSKAMACPEIGKPAWKRDKGWVTVVGCSVALWLVNAIY